MKKRFPADSKNHVDSKSRVTSYDIKITSYELKSTSYELKSISYVRY